MVVPALERQSGSKQEPRSSLRVGLTILVAQASSMPSQSSISLRAK